MTIARSAMKQQLIHLDRVAGELNAWLLAIAIGLATLDVTVILAKCIMAVPTSPASVSSDHSGTAVVPPLSSKIPESRG
jgi:hypothetical protein